ncbi:MAG: SDR family NAD(P)-dependent oxidoreductase [Campylobacterales bacterium]|nr:SDR family NAD(P)-dependent oxidoreductase [Campylobacterales bacterium]
MKILITGASSGLGAELARQYSSLDNELLLLARREDKLQILQKQLSSLCKDVQIIVADVTCFDELQEKLKTIEALDMVILNAGVSLGHTNTAIPTIQEFKNLYEVNVLANHAILEIVLPLFLKQKQGKVVFISSLASLFSMPSSKVYSSSKRALNAYAEGLRYKYAKEGVKVINILPGFIKSELTDKNDFTMPFLLETKEGVEKIKEAIEKNKTFYAFPKRFYFVIRLLHLLPEKIVHKIVEKITSR